LSAGHGYEVLIIWEDEYHNNTGKTIKKYIDFIYENNN